MSGVWVAYASAIPARKGDREAGAHTAGGSPERLLKARTLFSATITSTCLPTPQRASLDRLRAGARRGGPQPASGEARQCRERPTAGLYARRSVRRTHSDQRKCP